MNLTKEQILHIAKLARLKLTEEEIDKFALQISGVLEYVEILNELDTSKVEPTHQVTGLSNISRADEIARWVTNSELLACSELPIAKNQIKVKKVL